ncbi:MAG: 50S ribosomal protein L17 [candidate division WOR-3 bacterium]|nr:50S ribosomal protein L17 [candidate division WOR-3 bacterium]MCX7947272.1 50S ribosomal protein L17 [candidate division WOR-3 bacterium]MDW8150171.1 50S ribosomal protein L17 [candidate division WOR-3 bacterium]
MRHLNKIKKLSREREHRKALLRNLARSIFEKGYIITTTTKAKACKSIVDRILARATENTLHSRRLVNRFFNDRKLVKKIFDDIAPLYKNIKSGFTTIVKYGYRRGDGAELSLLKLINFPQKKEEKNEQASK